MQRVVIDTNVIVSALIQRNYPHKIIEELFIEHKIDLCISLELWVEYYEVLARPKFAKFPEFFVRAEALLIEIEKRAKRFSPTTKLNIISDADDNKILELANDCNAEYIITGNTNDFTFPFYKRLSSK